MAPEQCRSRSVDGRTDVYSMGVIMFEAFTGHLPFPGPSHVDVVNGHLSGAPPKPSTFTELPAELERLILRCLEKDPQLRPKSAAELSAELSAIGAALGSEPVPAAAGPQAGSTTRATVPSRPSRLPPRRRWPWVAIACTALATVAGVGLWRQQATPIPRQLEVGSDPPGARVLIDGRARPEPTPVTLSVDRGEVAVRLELEGHQHRDELVRFGPQERLRVLTLRLEPLPSALRVATDAPDAIWRVDGKPAGEGATLDLKLMSPGRHLVRVEAKGVVPREEWVTLVAAQQAALDWPLERVVSSKKRHGRGEPAAGVPDAPVQTFQPR
jgi:hypothetical protein